MSPTTLTEIMISQTHRGNVYHYGKKWAFMAVGGWVVLPSAETFRRVGLGIISFCKERSCHT